MEKVNQIVEELVTKGFSMTLSEFQAKQVYLVLEEYGIDARLTVEEYMTLVWKLFRLCCENELLKKQ